MSKYNYSNPSNRIRAAKMLEKLLPPARDMAKAWSAEADVKSDYSSIFKNMAAYLSEERLEGVHIYPAPLGGWHADVTLKNMPAGLPSVLGTPKANPPSTRGEATEAAVNVLAAILIAIDTEELKGGGSEPNKAVFKYDGVLFDVDLTSVEKITEFGTTSLNYVHQRLNEIRKEIIDGKELTSDIFDELPKEKQLQFMTVIMMALAHGIFRWPENPDGFPDSATKSVIN